jgi:GH35 family endo-1,4-beta-xylanase
MEIRRQRFFCFLFGLLMFVTLPVAWAAEAQDDLLRGAGARIEQHRKADASVAVVDKAGKPVTGIQVSIEQQRHEFLFGCNFFKFDRFEDPKEEAAYCDQFADLFNFATLGFYWPSYERQRGQPQHAYAQKVAQWCRQHGITPKGHPLAWNYFEPSWLPNDAKQVKQLQLDRIADCVSRFRGLIDTWDVVNEATHFEREGLLKRSPKLTNMWLETGRVEFVDECFKVARAANSEATLLINDYRVDPKYVQLIEQMANVSGERAYDTIGIQSHMHGGVWTNRKLWDVCERFASFGVPLNFTELTVLSGVPGWERTKDGDSWDSTPAGEKRQANDVRRIYTMLFSHPSVTAITWWDFADRDAWQRAPAGLIGKDLQPKPAYQTLKGLVKGEWWTRVALPTDAAGRVSFRGFLGEYLVTVKGESGKVVRIPLTIAKDKPNRKQIVL